MNDIQINEILAKAMLLSKNLKDELTRKVLEVGISADSTKKEIILNRAIRSLEQYINKEQKLIYIGFVGHYSSGKSSTLNNVFDFHGSNFEREVNLNPTDKAITLISHPKNSNGITLMSREGGEVPIRTVFVENTLLENTVISDTPGSGDPHVVNEMIQDFLPICDIIFYFISATNPIDQADIPLLEQKAKKLPFIPIKYVITRIDEFRLNRKLDVSEENLDSTRVDQFIGKLVSRINDTIPSQKISRDDFIFIDNLVKLNLDELKKIIIDSSKDLDNKELYKIHGYKIEYYRNNLNEIYRYFVTIIKSKIKQSAGYEKTAQENITRFDKNAQINNEKFRIQWSNSLNLINRAFVTEEQDSLTFQKREFVQIGSINRELSELSNQFIVNIKNLSNGYHGNIVAKANDEINQKFREQKRNFVNKINNLNLLIPELSNDIDNKLELTIDSFPVEIDLSKLSPLLKKYDSKLVSLFQEIKMRLISRCSSILKLIKEQQTISKIEEQYEIGKFLIDESFDKYFDLIQMYRSTVLTRNNKETIEKLRIGTQLDELDQEFDGSFMDKMKSKAISDIYIDNAKSFSDYRILASEIVSEISEIILNIKRVKIEDFEQPNDLGLCEVNVQNSIDNFVENKIEKSKPYFKEKIDALYEEHSNKYSTFLAKKNKRLKRRSKNIIRWTFITGIIFSFVAIMLTILQYLPAKTMFDGVLASIIANVIGNIIGYIIGRSKNKSETIISQSNNDFVSNRKNEIDDYFTEQFWSELKGAFDNNISLGQSSGVNIKYNNIVNDWKSKNKSKLEKGINEMKKEMKKVDLALKRYMQETEKLYKSYKKVFSEADENSQIIDNITQDIKDQSIKPSFELLSETTENLLEVKCGIEKINSTVKHNVSL